MSSLKLYFVVPDPDTFVSGGNIYNKKIIAALEAQMIEMIRIDFAAFEKQVQEKEKKAYYFLDTLYLKELNVVTINNAFFKEKCFLIVHHLESLYPENGQDAVSVFNQKEAPLLRLFKGFLTTSQYTKSYLVEQGLKDKNYIVVPPAIDKKNTIQKRNAEPIRIILVANIIKRKGILSFLEILKTKEIPNIKINIIGSCQHELTYFLQCKQLIASSLYLQKIINIKGVMPREAMPREYQNANLFVSTAYMETYGMAIQEAVYYRLPLLVLDAGNAASHVKPAVTGLVVKTMEDLVEKLRFLQKNKNYFQQLQEQAWDYRPYDNYNWQDAAISLVEQLRKNEIHSC